MEKFLEAAKIAWNPIGAARERQSQNNFTLVSMLVPYVGIVITCNLLVAGAQQFFFESLFYGVGSEMPDHPLFNSKFAQQALSATGVLVPLGAIAILPERMFRPSTRGAVLAMVLAVAAALAFYGAAMGIPIYIFSGLLAAGDPEYGFSIFSLSTFPTVIVQLVLLLVFWFRISGSILGIGGGKSSGILFVGVVSMALLVGLLATVMDMSP